MVDDRDDAHDAHAPTLISGDDASLPTLAVGGAVPAPSSVLPMAGPRYTLGAQIGRGGMGEVVGAYDEQIGRDVAVKRILAPAPSADELARFLREARVQGRLEHPAIVPVHDLGFDAQGRPYFVMKRLVGEAMSDLLQRMKASTDPEQAATIRRRLLRAFVDVCMALELAHGRQIVHRDLKPANLMLGDFGDVYVLDWGVARVVGDEPADPQTPHLVPSTDLDSGMTRVGAILGTPAYMAPEQLVGEAATPASDIYALGCVLFEIVAGEPLHARTRTAGSLVTGIEARPSTKRPEAPPELDAVCVRATALDPALRYPSARSLADAVQAFLDGDRDLAVRRALALVHLGRAQAALARNARSEAMREAGRSLALDPESPDAALLVTQFMLEPPAQTPP
ncbi:MAG: serine/threonine-protein kinase, partial [Proteobacteria bacterium]|nr:serine/threonine-protein kinase [Pseudomonadota bacterium]